ncbi:MAG: hypothetical protein HY692_10225, partial [Cyanobacteria bacterium NC_groundwater_1444_Ag_S-0.65um_54_12]|nr:hypothetical protein [Cyanobacteria bacterium NC_groundwater_1444_Ag_S-0.65um_54_12]
MNGSPLRFAEVLVDIPAAKHPYTYAVPREFEPWIEPGVAVRVPFGNRSEVGGFIVACPAPPPPAVAKIIRAVVPEQVLPTKMKKLLSWVADHYLASLYQVYLAALPRGILTGRSP